MPEKRGKTTKATDAAKKGSAAFLSTSFDWTSDAPNNQDAESGVLACILLDESKDALNACVSKRVGPDYFFGEKNRAIYEAVLAINDEAKPVDVILLSEKLKANGNFSDEMADYIGTNILGRVETIANFGEWIDILREKYFLRKISRECVKTLEKVRTSRGDIDNLLNDVEEAFLGINSDRVGDTIKPAKEQMKSVVAKIQTIIANKGAFVGIPTGFTSIDRRLRGLRPNEMVVIAGRPGTGKTSIALNIVESAIFGKEPTATLVFSLEMLADDLYMRMVASRARADQMQLSEGRLTKDKMADIYTTVKEIQGAPLWIDDTAGVRISEMRAKARRLNQQLKSQNSKLGLIVVDYLQLVRGSDQSLPREQEIAEISRGMKAMAKELLLPVIVLAQLNRDSEKEERPPRPSDLRESGSIEQDADAILLLSRQTTSKEVAEEGNWIIRADLAKNRNGPTGITKLLFNRSYTRYDNYLEADEETI